MLFKKFKPFASPKRFEMPDPDTGRLFKGTSIADLVQQIESYRKANELETLEYLPQVIENHLCSLPIHAGSCTPIKNPKRTVVQMIRGGVAILKNIAYSDFVPQEEADRRSAICKVCPKNQFPDRGYFIKWINDLAVKSVGERKAKHHDDLGICGACSCPLRGKVWFKGKIKLDPDQLKEMKALKDPKCWQPEFAE